MLTPLVTVTTDISFDHMEILGDTLEKIAAEKGGIIKPGVPHVLGLLPKPAERTLRDIAAQRLAPLTLTGGGRATLDVAGGKLSFESPALRIKNLRPSLAGEHQLKNAAVALETLAVLKGEGLRLPVSTIKRGIATAEWRGRFQSLTQGSGATVILDVCHNAAGASAFAQTFSRLYPGRKVPMIVGFVQKKEHQLMFDALSAIASGYWLVPLSTHRSVPLKDFLRKINFRGVKVHSCKSLHEAWSTLVKPAGRRDIIPVVGSHYRVGEYLGRYNKA